MRTVVSNRREVSLAGSKLTMMMIMPGVLSLRVKYAAMRRMTMVMGTATTVRANSIS